MQRTNLSGVFGCLAYQTDKKWRFMKTKHTLLALSCIFLVIFSCKDGNRDPFFNTWENQQQPSTLESGKKYLGQGEIVRLEIAACMCCGGYWLKTTEADSVLFRQVPENSGFIFDDNDQFPIPVEYEFVTDSSVCWQVKRLVTMISIKKI